MAIGSEVSFNTVKDYLVATASGEPQEITAEKFLEFRKMVRPDLVVDAPFPEAMAVLLVQFFHKMMAGKRPKLALFTPPQHGKSLFVRDFIAWTAGFAPHLKIIFASYSDDLGESANSDIARIMQLPDYVRAFTHMQIGATGWKVRNDFIEFPGHKGFFRNTTAPRGQITGFGFDLGIIDDPHKGRAEAYSATERNKVWSWFTDDFLSRMSKSGAVLLIMTRWHVDDLMGRYFQRMKGDDWDIGAFPAIAERDYKYRKTGEALFEELKPLEFLLEQKKLLTEASWQAMYQQHPVITGGGVIPVEYLRILPVFNKGKIKRTVRYWDKSGTEDGGAFTAGVRMHLMEDKSYVISNIVRGQWSAREREDRIKATSAVDKKEFPVNYTIMIEQEPGSGGKESAENTIRSLAGYSCFADKVTGSKEIRAEPWIAQVQGDNVRLCSGDWVFPFWEECEQFPASRYKDQVDAAAGAFNRLIKGYGYDRSYSGFV